MKLITVFMALLSFSSCSQLSKIIAENKIPTAAPVPKNKKITYAKKVNEKAEISGKLSNDMTYEATAEEGGFIISLDPFMEQNDKVFTDACNQLLAKLYNDKIQDESHVSIKSDIDYIIFKGYKARYKTVPFKESNGEISSMTISILK